MVRKNKLTINTEELVAYNLIKSSFDSFAKRADRKLKPLAGEVYSQLENKRTYSQNSLVQGNYRFEMKDKARTLTEGIKEFSERYPQYGKKLKGIIAETRKTKARYLQFGLVDDRELPEQVYENALRNIGVNENLIGGTLETALELGDLLQRKREDGLVEMLVK